MKSLHKKIGAMVLAGMVVLGGVAAGGVNSFAASKIDYSLKSNIQKVKFVISKNPFNGEIVKFSKDKNEIRNMGGSRRIQHIPNDQLELSLYKLKNQKNVKIEYKGVYYSINFNK